jgi:hypothetical protein
VLLYHAGVEVQLGFGCPICFQFDTGNVIRSWARASVPSCTRTEYANFRKFEKIRKYVKIRVNSKKSGEKCFSNLDRLIHLKLNFIKFVQIDIKF